MTADLEALEQRITALEARNEELARALADRPRPLARRARPTNGRDWDAYAAVIASLVGLLALAVSGYTAYVQREQLRAQVWPKLALGNSNVMLKLYASNQGVGPARVTAVRVTVDGKPMRHWDEVKRAFGYGEDAEIFFSSLNGRVIAGDKDLEIAYPRPDDASRAMFRDLLEAEKHSFNITVCYCSVQNDCWVTHYGSDRPERERKLPPDECPIAESEQFRN